jgi:hypothetical protein
MAMTMVSGLDPGSVELQSIPPPGAILEVPLDSSVSPEFPASKLQQASHHLGFLDR